MKFNDCISCILVSLILQVPLHGLAQNREPVPSNRVQSIAFIDEVRLRREYVELNTARKKMYDEGTVNKRSFDSTQRQINEQLNKSLKKDSSAGEKQKQAITDKASANRSALESHYHATLKKRNEARIALMKTYEGKIGRAVQTVVAEGGFTEIKPVSDSAKFKGTNITNTVLQKLNNH